MDSSPLLSCVPSMVDYSVSMRQQRPQTHTEVVPFKMEQLALMTVLECPLCLEQLDFSAKVLPCQHTFCKACLQRQESAAQTHQLLCPDCGDPVPARTVDELPTNLLLVRLLESLQGSAGPSGNRQSGRYSAPADRSGTTIWESQPQQEGQHRETQGHSEVSARPQAFCNQ